MHTVGKKGRGKGGRRAWHQGRHRRALCQACLTSSVVSQRDTASDDDDGEQSGFGIRASTCVLPRNGRGTGKQGVSKGGRATGCERNCGHAVQGSVAVPESLEQRVLAQVQKEEPEDMKGLA